MEQVLDGLGGWGELEGLKTATAVQCQIHELEIALGWGQHLICISGTRSGFLLLFSVNATRQ